MEKIMKATCTWLKELGAQIVETDYVCAAGCADVVYIEGGELAFASIEMKEEGQPIKEHSEDAYRAQMQAVAACYLKSHDAQGRKVRFDHIGVMPFGANMASFTRLTDIFATTFDNNPKQGMAAKRTENSKSTNPSKAKKHREYER
jgi:Holliday junction resolvase-like predicted endonuclease